MPTDCISYQTSGYFSKLIQDYLNQEPKLQTLYHHFPALENFEKQLEEKKQNYNDKDGYKRALLVRVLEQQYANLKTSAATLNNIQLLSQATTFTITTGHQLNLLSGPLYFLYKIISTINLSRELKVKYPNHNFVPIYWMATEDHDFEEINYFHFKGKKFHWNKESSGPVGRLSTSGLEELLKLFSLEIGHSSNAKAIINLFEAAYLKQHNLADATRYLANALFEDYGLVIMDADQPELKRQFIPYIKEELLQQTAYEKVRQTNEKLSDYFVQVNPREINLFYIEDHLRERILLENGLYKVNHSKLQFSQEQILSLLENYPERFSPNVIMRPLYQEVLLPNLCYIGGGGEIAYWLELKSYFESAKVSFPILLLRNSVLLTSEKQNKKADRLELSWSDLFAKQPQLLNTLTQRLSEFPIDFREQKNALRKQFEALVEMAKQTDKSFMGAVLAQQRKQIKGLEQLEKRLLKAQKRKYEDELQRVLTLQNELFPNKSLQERFANFSEFYLENGDELIPRLIEELRPLEQDFKIITY